MSWFERDRYPHYPCDHGLPIDESAGRLARFCGLVAFVARLNVDGSDTDRDSAWTRAATRFERAADHAEAKALRACNEAYRDAIRELEADFGAPIQRAGLDRLWVASRSAGETALLVAALTTGPASTVDSVA